MLKALLCLFAFVAAISNGQEHHRCLSPNELTFRAYQHDWDTKFRARFFVEYDRANKQTVMFGDEHKGHLQRIQEYLFLHEQKVGYDINLEKKTCKKFKIGEFHPFGVSPNSTYDGTYGIGAPAHTLDIDRWIKRHPSGHVLMVQEFTKHRCYPVSQFIVDEQNINKTLSTSVFDVVVGIADPNAFNVPTYCDKAAPEGQITPEANFAISMFTHKLDN